MKRIALITTSFLLINGCASPLAPNDAVRDATTATKIGMEACGQHTYANWYRDNPAERWRATLTGNYWNVSEPAEPRYPGVSDYSIQVAKRDGSVSDCAMTVE